MDSSNQIINLCFRIVPINNFNRILLLLIRLSLYHYFIGEKKKVSSLINVIIFLFPGLEHYNTNSIVYIIYYPPPGRGLGHETNIGPKYKVREPVKV